LNKVKGKLGELLILSLLASENGIEDQQYRIDGVNYKRMYNMLGEKEPKNLLQFCKYKLK
jgi:hypothetical protein